MLVDDDHLTILKNEKIFPWKQYSFDLIYSTVDSCEALKYMLKLKPDVVFTDISMYDVDGFELIDYAKKHGLETLFVIISGYNDFNYAQTAIRHGVVDYMLKPVDAEDCSRILSVLKDMLDAKNNVINDELSEKINIEIFSAKFHISNKNFQELVNYINKNYTKTLSLSDLVQKFNLNISYCCQLFQKYFECSFSEYIVSLKMRKAVELLTSDDMTIREIAESLNYDYNHFCKTFKKFLNMTPRMYRQTYCDKGVSGDDFAYEKKEET